MKLYKQLVLNKIGDKVVRDGVMFFAAKPYIKSTCDRCCFYDRAMDICTNDGSVVTNCLNANNNYIIKKVILSKNKK